MAYCVITDLQKMIPDRILIQLSDEENGTTINAVRVQESIDSGAEEIDAYIGAVAALPITGDVPAILGKLNADIAIYNLYSRLQEKIPDTRQTRYDDAIKLLDRIASGSITFGLQPKPEAPVDVAAEVSIVSTRDTIYTPEMMEQYL